MSTRTRPSSRLGMLALLGIVCLCAMALAACSNSSSSQSQTSSDEGRHAEATYAALVDGSLVGQGVHFQGTIDFPFHDDDSDWQGYLIAVEDESANIVAAWYDAPPAAEWLDDGCAVEVWGTLDGLSYRDENGEQVDLPHVTIEAIEATGAAKG